MNEKRKLVRFNLAEAQQKATETESWVKPQNCMVCEKLIPGAYGRWAIGWTCSKHCEGVYRDTLFPRNAPSAADVSQ